MLYNRVDSINRVASEIERLVPEASVAVGHGKMREHQLEDIIMDFSNGEYNVLVSTTIIESGMDIPNVNTMIVLDADHFGLAQLYQLRGRVGRSDRMAYAYLKIRRLLRSRKKGCEPSRNLRSLAPASRSPCVIWSFVAPGIFWERSSRAIC